MLDLEAIKARAEALANADEFGKSFKMEGGEEALHFYLNADRDIPALIAEVERLRAERFKFIRCSAPGDILVASRDAYADLANAGNWGETCGHAHLIIREDAEFKSTAQ